MAHAGKKLALRPVRILSVFLCLLCRMLGSLAFGYVTEDGHATRPVPVVLQRRCRDLDEIAVRSLLVADDQFHPVDRLPVNRSRKRRCPLRHRRHAVGQKDAEVTLPFRWAGVHSALSQNASRRPR